MATCTVLISWNRSQSGLPKDIIDSLSGQGFQLTILQHSSILDPEMSPTSALDSVPGPDMTFRYRPCAGQMAIFQDTPVLIHALSERVRHLPAVS